MPKTITLDWDEYQRLVRGVERRASLREPTSIDPDVVVGLLLNVLLKRLGGRVRVDWLKEGTELSVIQYTRLSDTEWDVSIRPRDGLPWF